MENHPKTLILLVEDETSLARSIQLELEHQGYQVAIAKNGYEALNKFTETKWDLILLDTMSISVI